MNRKSNTDQEADAAPPRRPGRPRISETDSAAMNDETRRTRMRLAQRSYRSRKQNALVSAKARAEVLEGALDGSIDEFIRFYEKVSKKKRELPADIIMELNKTAMNIVSIARKAHMEKYTSANGQIRLPGEDATDSIGDVDSALEPSSILAGPFPTVEKEVIGRHHCQKHRGPVAGSKPVSVSQRLLLACLTRTVALLQLGNIQILALTPTMLLPLKLERPESLLERAAQRLSDHPNAFLSDCQYSDGQKACLPKMMRLVEGNLNSLQPRSPPPNLERLQFGLTRTMLHTAISDFQGEWLEAPDVEEYLEQRGIFIRIGSPSDMISLSAPTIVESGSEADKLNLIRHRGINVPRLDTLSNVTNPQAESSTNQGLGMQFYSSGGGIVRGNDSATHTAIPEHDYTIFGRTFKESQAVPTGLNDFTISEWYPEMGFATDNTAVGQQGQDLKITVDLDKLIRGLADKAICLGPCPGIRRTHVDEAIRGSVINLQQRVE
ncbi:hypothetical protein ACHAQJ_003607 [Trichoderma viride]